MQPQNERLESIIVEDWHGVDPIDAIQVGPGEGHVAIIGQGIDEIAEILEHDDTLNDSERRRLVQLSLGMQLDRVYTKGGQVDVSFQETWQDIKNTQGYFVAHSEIFRKVPESALLDKWSYGLQGLNIEAFIAHKLANQAETTYADTPKGEQLAALASSQERAMLRRSSELIREIAGRAGGSDQLSREARGILYETLLVSYCRLKQYEAETLATEFTRTSLAREDSPYNGYAYPNRGFDVVISKAGHSDRLIQAKNYQEDEAYAYPIQKISPKSFHEIWSKISTYAADFRIAVENSSDPAMKDRIDAAYDRLEGAFGEPAPRNAQHQYV